MNKGYKGELLINYNTTKDSKQCLNLLAIKLN